MSFKEFSPYSSVGAFGKHRFSEPACPGLPHLPQYKPQKDAGGSYWRQLSKEKELATDLDPTVLEFQYPDFGFTDKLNGHLTNCHENDSIWRTLYFQISANPKYERLNNVIISMAN